jgi:hypothetical protein
MAGRKVWPGAPVGCVRVCPHDKVVFAVGWYLCVQRCGYLGVCRACLGHAPQQVPWMLCPEHAALVQGGGYRCAEGYVVPVEVTTEASGALAEQRKDG